MNYRIIYYKKENGRSPVKEFIDKLPKKAGARTYKTFEIIEEFGMFAGMPYVKRLVGKLWEIRVSSDTNIYRYICTTEKDKIIILLSGFQKKTQKTPKKEIEKAKKLLKEL